MRGFTLTELLVVLGLVAILMALGSAQSGQLIDAARLDSNVSMHHQALYTARHIAVTAGRNVTLCPADAALRCTGRWGSDLALFFDDERNGLLEEPRDLVARVVIPEGGRVRVAWRGFGRPKFLTVRANGAYRQNGRFTFCPASTAIPLPGRSLVVNVTGRTRVERIRCPK